MFENYSFDFPIREKKQRRATFVHFGIAFFRSNPISRKTFKIKANSNMLSIISSQKSAVKVLGEQLKHLEKKDEAVKELACCNEVSFKKLCELWKKLKADEKLPNSSELDVEKFAKKVLPVLDEYYAFLQNFWQKLVDLQDNDMEAHVLVGVRSDISHLMTSINQTKCCLAKDEKA